MKLQLNQTETRILLQAQENDPIYLSRLEGIRKNKAYENLTRLGFFEEVRKTIIFDIEYKVLKLTPRGLRFIEIL